MSSLDDPKLREAHDQIQQALNWSSPPNFQKVCEVLNGMSMDDMLDELWRIKSAGQLDRLAMFIPKATGVNNVRLRAAAGAEQDQPPPNLDALTAILPDDQQRAIKSVRAQTHAPDSLSPDTWSRFYWSTRLLPTYIPPPDAPTADKDDSAGGKSGDDDDSPHLGLDIGTALAAGAPAGTNRMTYTITAVYRDLNAFKFGDDNTEIDLLHEPSISVQISPDPNSPAAYQASLSLINTHLKRNWGLVKPDLEFSLGGAVGMQGGSANAALQAQVEVHVTTKVSVVLGSSLGVGPGIKPGDTPDPGARHFGNSNVDLAFTPFTIGILGHWDPPTK
jgi:hypothetical protein